MSRKLIILTGAIIVALPLIGTARVSALSTDYSQLFTQDSQFNLSVLFPQLPNYVLVDLWGFRDLLQWLLLGFFLCAGFLNQISLPLLFVIDLLKN